MLVRKGDKVKLETNEIASVVESFVYVEVFQIREMVEVSIEGRHVVVPMWAINRIGD